jgi:hypothetical protein
MSRSLGTLTLDLVAKIGGFTGPMDKASRTTKKTATDIAKGAAVIGTAFAAAGAAAAAGLVAIVNKQRELIDTQSKAAQMLGTTYTSLQNLARAGDLGGVSMEKIEAASRQLTLNIGKAIQGVDAQAHAFDRLGLSAQELSELPLDQRIAKINTALRDNVQASERAAVAADIFGAKNGLAIQLLDPDTIAEAARQVELFGLNLSEIDANLVEQANDSLSTFGLLADGIGKQLTVQLAPILNQIGVEFMEAAEEAGGLGNVVEDVFEGMIDWIGKVLDAIEGMKRGFQLIAQYAYIADAQIGMIRPEFLGGFSDEQGQSIIAKAQREITRINSALMPSDELKAWVTEAQNAAVAAAEVAIANRELGTTTGEAGVTAAVAAESERERVAVLKELERTALAAEKALERARETEARWQQSTNMAAQGIRDSLRTEEEAILESYERRRQIILDNTLYTGEAQAELLRRLEDQRNEELLEITGSFWERYLAAAEDNLTTLDQVTADLLDNVSSQFGNAFESMIFDAESLGDAMRGLAEDMLRTVVNAIGQMIAQWLAMQAVQMLIGRTTEAAAIAGATATGAAVAAAYAPAAAMASLASFGANAAPAIAGMAATAATAQGLALVGMAHDGIDRVPKTGTWLLEKGERVMTSGTSARLDAAISRMNGGGAPVVNIQNAPPGNHIANTRRGPDGQMIIDVLLADLNSDGPASRAISGSYGLRRRGR